jgi:hypothetical protein
MVAKRVTVRLSGSKGSINVRMVLDPSTSPTRIPSSVAKKIGATELGRVELDGKVCTISLSIVPNGEGNCPALGRTAIEGLGLEADGIQEDKRP